MESTARRSAGTPLFNIKGGVTNINNGTLTNDGITQTDPNALFGESITYYETSPLSGATPQYNGNISGMTWRNKIEASGKPGVTTGGQGYAIDYDNVNRITASNYYTQTGSTFTPSAVDAFNEKVLGYDEAGNINRLDRSDKTGAALNSLFYTYGTYGNQLTSIYDNVLHPVIGTFTYDGNGNMLTNTYDSVSMHYNYLDLIDTVSRGNSKLVFTYDAAGNKLYKQLITSGTVVSQRHYIEDAEVVATTSIATDGKIESVAMDEGRVLNTGAGGYKYEYNLQDHLFNNRVNFQVEHNGNITLSQVQNYYPFGASMGDSTMNYSTLPTDFYKYSGKELQPELDLNTYDFGARQYYPVFGRWMGMDPMAVSFDDQSPYNFVGNNPLNFIDPDGMQYKGSLNPGQWTGPSGSFGNSTLGLNSAWGIAGQSFVGANGLYEGFKAIGAFSISHSSIEDFSSINRLQGNALTMARSSIPQTKAPAVIDRSGISYDKRMQVKKIMADAERIQDFRNRLNYRGPYHQLRPIRDGIDELFFENGILQIGAVIISDGFSLEAEESVGGFRTFRDFKSYYGRAGDDIAWHHIVEQTPANIEKFGPEAIHNIKNVVKLEHGAGSIHAKISGYYSSIQPFSEGMTVRKWLSTQTFEQQFNFGVKTLRNFGFKH